MNNPSAFPITHNWFPLSGACLITFIAINLFIASASWAQTTESKLNSRTDSKGVPQVLVPIGCFMMGANDSESLITKLNAPAWVRNSLGYEDPMRKTCLTKDYWIDVFEVTNNAYQAFVDAGGYTNSGYWSESGRAWLKQQKLAQLPQKCDLQIPEYPRVCVTWYEAEAYAHWRGGRLPTEAEWEYAARGTHSWVYPWGNQWDATKTNVINSKSLTAVGSYPEGKSWVGAYDLAGNAMEWVQDWLSKDYPKRKVRDNPPGPETGSHKIEKGGWWGSNSFVARSAYKHYEDTPDYQDHHIGFRIVAAADF